MKFKKDVYLNWNPFEGDRDVDVKLYSTSLVVTRKEHDCMLATNVGNEYHKIEKGQLVFYEHAVVDGEWCSSYACLDCFDKFLIENANLEPDNV